MTVKIVGILDLPQDTGGYVDVQMQESVARDLFSDGSPAYVEASAVQGVSSEQLTQRIESVVGSDYSVQTGAQVRQQEKDQVNKFLDVFNYILLGFAAIGLVVGTFIIYNTFSMIIAQRVRELALLRAIGAGRSQITRSVLLEAFVVGVFAGRRTGYRDRTGGAVAGDHVVELRSAVRVVGDHAERRDLLHGGRHRRHDGQRLRAGPTRVAGVAGRAMRESQTDGATSLRRRTLIGALLAVVGVVLIGVGTTGQGASWAATVGIGAFVMILAVVFAAPALSRPAVGLLGRVLGRPFGKIGCWRARTPFATHGVPRRPPSR